MSIFSSILRRIFDHSSSAASGASSPASAPATAPANDGAPAPVAATPAPTAATGEASQNRATSAALPQLGQADVEAVLTGLAAKKGGGGNWKTSIVDLLRLLDLDPSLNARKELATELNVHVGEHGSAEQNIALSKAVWQQLAQNGGKVPDSLKS